LLQHDHGQGDGQEQQQHCARALRHLPEAAAAPGPQRAQHTQQDHPQVAHRRLIRADRQVDVARQDVHVEEADEQHPARPADQLQDVEGRRQIAAAQAEGGPRQDHRRQARIGADPRHRPHQAVANQPPHHNRHQAQHQPQTGQLRQSARPDLGDRNRRAEPDQHQVQRAQRALLRLRRLDPAVAHVILLPGRGDAPEPSAAGAPRRSSGDRRASTFLRRHYPDQVPWVGSASMLARTSQPRGGSPCAAGILAHPATAGRR